MYSEKLIMSNFIDFNLKIENLHNFHLRTAIFIALQEAAKKFDGKLLDIGCGKMPYKNFLLENSRINEYVGLDIESAVTYDKDIKPDFTWDGRSMHFEDEYFDCAFGTEVLEHCPEPEVILNEVCRILKPGGVFFFTVPFLWNLHETPNDEYRYTPFALKRHLKNSGFSSITIKATGGWHASMAQMLGLWVRRSPMSSRNRKRLSIVLKPIIKFLIKRDNPETVKFNDGQMITGLSGIAIKNL